MWTRRRLAGFAARDRAGPAVVAYRDRKRPAVLRSAERGRAVVHTLDIDVTVLRGRSNNRGVDAERVDNIAASPRGFDPAPRPGCPPWSRTARLGRRSRHPAPKCPPPPISASRVVLRVRVDAFRGERGCVGNYRTLWLRGQPSPTPGHARPPRARLCRVPTQLSCGPDPSLDGDHGMVALRATRRARPQVREAKTSISQRAHRIGHPPSRPPRDRSARSATRPIEDRWSRQQEGARPGVLHLQQTETSRRRGSRQPHQLAQTWLGGPPGAGAVMIRCSGCIRLSSRP
jgi:hypothetical protein